MSFKNRVCLLVCFSLFARAESSGFFANEEIQRESPQAFALQPEAREFVLKLELETFSERENLVRALQGDDIVRTALGHWEQLSIEEQIPVLKRIFQIEVAVMGIQAPELIIQDGVIPGPAFFEFDLQTPGPGKVFLNPVELRKEPKFASLALLIHETRHSAQFQRAFGRESSSSTASLNAGFRAAFAAQKTLQEKLSFCDFLTLLNEYEAFQFGNFVIGRLTNWQVDMIGMGTFASQYDREGSLKIDLARWLEESPHDNLLLRFNRAEVEQEKQLKGN